MGKKNAEKLAINFSCSVFVL